MNENISELIDQRGDTRQRQAMFERILADQGARKVWMRYHLIGCVLRGEVERTGADLSERIGVRLAAEPTVLAPTASKRLQRTPRRWRASWKPAALALAASVVLAAVIVLNPVTEEDGGRLVGDVHDHRATREVNVMLAQHGEFTATPALNGLAAYAKLVSNEPLKRQ